MLHTPETFSFEQLRRLRELSVTPADVSVRYLLLHPSSPASEAVAVESSPCGAPAGRPRELAWAFG